MTSIKWSPKPFIYTPPPVIYGCFKLVTGGDLIDCLKELFLEITDSLYQAYDIKSYLKVITEDYLINVNNYTQAKKSILNKESYDYKTYYRKELNKIINRLRLFNKPQGLLIDKNRIHFAQIISDLFNPELTKDLLVSLSSIILKLSPEPSKGAQATIKNNYLRINTKLLKPDYIG